MTAVRNKGYAAAIHFNEETDDKIGDILTVSKDNLKRLDHPEWAPTWDLKDDHAFDNIPPFKHIDRGLFADPTFKNLLADENVTFREITPKLGLEVEGIQLSKLNNKQKDELALLVAKKGVVTFRNQDFKHQGFEEIKQWGKYFGPLHVHPTSGAPLNHPEFHLVFRRGAKEEQEIIFADRLNSIVWHSDTTYENQTPALTLFAMLQCGESGGDTQFIDLFEVYDRLSPLMKKKLEGLKVLHTSKDQAYNAAAGGGIERKDPIDSIHPLIRYHPVIKRKFLFFNKAFGRKILGLKTEESDNLLLFLRRHIESCLDAHVRISWDATSVAVWDNRRVVHTATNDWDSAEIRHAFRLISIGERPVESAEEYERWTPELEVENMKLTEYYATLSAAEYYEKVIKSE